MVPSVWDVCSLRFPSAGQKPNLTLAVGDLGSRNTDYPHGALDLGCMQTVISFRWTKPNLTLAVGGLGFSNTDYPHGAFGLGCSFLVPSDGQNPNLRLTIGTQLSVSTACGRHGGLAPFRFSFRAVSCPGTLQLSPDFN